MGFFSWIWFKFVYWFTLSRKTRQHLAWIVGIVDSESGSSWQPLSGVEKLNVATVLAMDYFGKQKKQQESDEIIKDVEWAVQRYRGRKFVSSRPMISRLAKKYKSGFRLEDKSWGLSEKEKRSVEYAIISLDKKERLKEIETRKKRGKNVLKDH